VTDGRGRSGGPRARRTVREWAPGARRHRAPSPGTWTQGRGVRAGGVRRGAGGPGPTSGIPGQTRRPGWPTAARRRRGRRHPPRTGRCAPRLPPAGRAGKVSPRPAAADGHRDRRALVGTAERRGLHEPCRGKRRMTGIAAHLQPAVIPALATRGPGWRSPLRLVLAGVATPDIARGVPGRGADDGRGGSPGRRRRSPSPASRTGIPAARRAPRAAARRPSTSVYLLFTAGHTAPVGTVPGPGPTSSSGPLDPDPGCCASSCPTRPEGPRGCTRAAWLVTDCPPPPPAPTTGGRLVQLADQDPLGLGTGARPRRGGGRLISGCLRAARPGRVLCSRLADSRHCTPRRRPTSRTDWPQARRPLR